MDDITNHRFVRLGLGRIDRSDEFFRHSPEWIPADHRLRTSIRTFGILNPLRVQEQEGEMYRIVEGFRRLSVAAESGFSSVPVVAVKGEDLELFMAAVAENAGSRPLVDLEKAEIVRKLLRVFALPESRVVQEVLPLLGVRPSLRLGRRLLHLAELPEHLKRANAESLETETALALSEWDDPEQRFFLDLLDRYRLGSNKQKQLLELLDELRRRDRVTAMEVWTASGADDPGAEGLSPAQRFSSIRKALRELRYPTIARHEERFRRLSESLKLPRHVSVRHPPEFEGATLEISVQVRSPEEIRSAGEALVASSNTEACRELFKLI